MIEMLQEFSSWLLAAAATLVCIMLAGRILLIKYGRKKGNWRQKF